MAYKFNPKVPWNLLCFLERKWYTVPLMHPPSSNELMWKFLFVIMTFIHIVCFCKGPSCVCVCRCILLPWVSLNMSVCVCMCKHTCWFVHLIHAHLHSILLLFTHQEMGHKFSMMLCVPNSSVTKFSCRHHVTNHGLQKAHNIYEYFMNSFYYSICYSSLRISF